MVHMGIISDTHIGNREVQTETFGIPPVVIKTIQSCDLIVHCGDIGHCKEVLQFLSGFAPVTAVKGNHDKHTKEHIPSKAMLNLDGWQIGITHGHGDNVRKEPLSIIKFFKEPLDMIIFGHIHQPLVYADQDLILLNSGSTSSTAYTPFASFMTAIFNENQVEATIHILNKKRDHIEHTRKSVFYKKC